MRKVITHNDRIHITHDEHNTWNLHIRFPRIYDSPVIIIKITQKRGSCCQGGINCGNAATALRAEQRLCEPMSA